MRCVPPAGRVRMLWADILDDTGGISSLHDLLAGELCELGLHTEARRFRPHLTLARVRRVPDTRALRVAAEAFGDRRFGRQRACEIVVYSSMLTAAGPVYSPLAKAELGR